jgi:amino acid transporter
MTAARSATASAHRAATSDKMRALARLGLAAHGAVYVLIGVLAVLLAFGDRSKETDQQGALQELAQNTGGWALLLVIAVGLAAYALWRFTQAALGSGDGDGAKERAKDAGRGVAYAALAVSAFTVVVNGRAQSQSKSQQTWTARIMQHDGGRWLIGLVGAVVVVVGVVFIYRGATEKFKKHLELSEMSPGARKTTEILGLVGTIARGVVIVMVGVLLITAAVQYDPGKARGLDGALRALRDTPVGPWLLVAVALGLVMFGLFGFCEARWRKL